MDQNNPKYQEAQKHVRALRGFYINLVTYLIINAFLVVFNYLTSPGNWWFYWVTLGWGNRTCFPGVGCIRKVADVRFRLGRKKDSGLYEQGK